MTILDYLVALTIISILTLFFVIAGTALIFAGIFDVFKHVRRIDERLTQAAGEEGMDLLHRPRRKSKKERPSEGGGASSV